MTYQEAMAVIEDYKTNYGHQGLLETLENMRENFEWIDRTQKQAFRVVFAEMARLFAPA